MRNKLLTIVIPTYNMEGYLSKCLNSLIINDKELFNKIEILIINDGSKDNSSSIGHAFESKYPGIFYIIDKENGNYGSCINRGLNEATGKYIKILDADDFFDTDVFEAFVHLLSEINADLIISDFDVVDGNDNIMSNFNFDGIIKPKLVLDFHQIISSKVFDIQMHATCYKKSIFDNINYHQIEGVSYTDQQWTFYPLTQIKSIYYFPKPLYKYLIGREGQTMANIAQVKNIDQLMVVALEMARVYDEEQWNRSIYGSFLENKLKRQLKVIYETEIIANKNVLEIKEFDKQLTKYTESFQIPTSFEFRRLHYVNYLRNHNYKYIPTWLIYIYKIYNRIISFMGK